jgi:phage terminase large subunit-like protein
MDGWNFACPDWPERLRDGRPLIPDLPLDAKDAGRAVGIFNKLRLPDVPGQPALADAAGDWQRDIVRAIFGSLVDGARMVPELFIEVPKKNSKTTGGAGITLTGLLMNERPRAEFIYVGPTQEVADLAFQQTVGMIEADEYLTKRFAVAHHVKTIIDRRNKAKLKVKTFDMKVVTGSKPVFVLLDEVHLMAQIASASRIIGQIRGGMLPNPEAVLVMITTQSDEPPSGAFKAELEYARGVRDGRIAAGRVLPVIYEFPEAVQRSGEWRDPSLWPMVLPNLGRSITLDRLVADYEVARQKGDGEERRWASQHLNIEIGVALANDRWAGADFWEGAADPTLTLEELIDRCEVIVPGIDGGGLDDLFGLTVLGRDAKTKDWLCWSHAWCHRIVLERRKIIAPKLLDFERAGDLTIVDDPGDDVADIVSTIALIRGAGKLAHVAVDPAGLGEMVDALAEIGVTEESGELVGAKQGYAMMNAIKTAERKLANGTLKHAGQALMAWCVGNLKIEPTATAIRATKQNAGDAKIDLVMALFDAVTFMSLNPEPSGGGPSIYENRPLLMV